MSTPIDHHYLPIFYLSRWGNPSNNLNVYCHSKPWGDQITGKWYAPSGTGKVRNLYTFSDARGSESINLESELLQVIDDGAAKVLIELESGNIPKNGSKMRSDWSRFLVCQQMRCPEDIRQLKSMLNELWQNQIPELQKGYDEWRQGQGPEKLSEMMELHFPFQASEVAAETARKILAHEGITNLLSGLLWRVITFGDDCHKLFTSDRPIWISSTLTEPDDFLFMPIGPRKLFVAAKNEEVFARMNARSKRQLSRTTNLILARTALNFVYATDSGSKDFVQKHFSKLPHSRLLELLAVNYGVPIVNPRSPSS